LLAKNLVRGRVGRAWMAIRDRDIAAEIIGVRPLRTKLLAFGISSFYCGVAGAEYVFLYLGSAETLAFDINLSFLVLVMVIIGGLGSILGSFLGAAFIVMVPIFLTNAPHALGLAMPVALQKQIELMVFGGLIIFFLIVEPHGLARLWQITKEKLRLWPFPHYPGGSHESPTHAGHPHRRRPRGGAARPRRARPGRQHLPRAPRVPPRALRAHA